MGSPHRVHMYNYPLTLPINHVLFIHTYFTGGTSPRPLPLLPSAVQPQRTGIRGHVHPHRNARDPGMRGPGCHQCLYHDPLDGHASGAYRQEVSIHEYLHYVIIRVQEWEGSPPLI